MGKVINGVVDAVTPSFIPRPVAKAAVAFFGISFVFSLVQKVILHLSMTIYAYFKRAPLTGPSIGLGAVLPPQPTVFMP